MKKYQALILVAFLMNTVIYAQNEGSIFLVKSISIEELLKEKQNDKQQQNILIKFRDNFDNEADIRVINEFQDYYEITVSHKSSEEYTGGTEGYKLNKETGKSEMTWHEHPMKTEGQQIKKIMKKANILGLRTTIYKVGELEKAKKWYATAFETEPYFDEAFYVGFNIGGYELGLLPEENPTSEKTESVLTYWGVNEIEKVYKHFIESGATEHEKPHSVGGPLMVASVKDPWGNIIGLIYNPAFKLTE